MTLKAFVASTYEDLAQHRARVIQALRNFGIHVDPMENWTATTDEPKRFSQARLDGCDLCVLLVAFRRGHIPAGETASITQLEYRAALKEGMALFVYLLRDAAEWDDRFDDRDADPEIGWWRAALVERHGVGFFEGEPASIDSIQSAIGRWLVEKVEATPRPLQLPDNLVGLEEPAMMAGSEVSQIEQKLTAVNKLGGRDVIVVELRGGHAWWSTRLFLLACLIQDFTDVRLVAFADEGGYLGMTTPAALATGLAAAQPDLPVHYRKHDDDAKELAISVSANRFAESFGGRENTAKSWVTSNLLRAQLGARLNADQVRISDPDEMSTELFLYEVVRKDAGYVAVIDRDGSLVLVVDRVKLATEIAQDQLAAHLR